VTRPKKNAARGQHRTGAGVRRNRRLNPLDHSGPRNSKLKIFSETEKF